MAITLTITSVVITALDSLCLSFILKQKPLWKPSTWGIVNLLCCHLIQGIVVVPSYILKRLKFQDKDISGPVCDVFRFSYMTTNYASCISLLLISADRMYAVRKPLSYRSNMTSRKMAGCILASWVYTMMLCLIPFTNSSTTSPGECTYLPQKQWTIAMLMCNTLLPLLLIMICYCAIFDSARRSRIARLSICSSNASVMHRRSEMSIAKTSAVIVSAYVICWGPSFVYYSLASICPNCLSTTYLYSDAEEVVTFSMKYLTFLSGIVSPIIYGSFHKGTWMYIFQRRRNRIAPTKKIAMTSRTESGGQFNQ